MKAIPSSTTDTISGIPSSPAYLSGDTVFPGRSDFFADTFEIVPYTHHYMPFTPLKSNNHLLGDLIFTLSFIIIFSFIRLRGKDIFYHLLLAVIKRKKTETILNEGILPNLVYYLLSLTLSFAVLAVFISYIAWGEYLNIYTLYLFTGLSAYHFLLLLLVRLLGWTFNSKALADEVIVNLWTFHSLTGLLVSPFIIASFFVHNFAAEQLLKIVILGISLFFIVKIVRWLEILFSYRVSILYMILYLCALEIMPLLVLYKLVA